MPSRAGVEQDLEEVRRAGIGRRAVGLDQVELLLGVAGAGRDHRAAERAGGGIEDEAARRQVIAEGVVHDVAAAETGGEQRARAVPRIGLGGFRLEDRAGRDEQVRERAGLDRDEAAEGQGGLLLRRQPRLAHHRQLRQRGAAGDRIGVDALEPRGVARRRQRRAHRLRQPREQVGLARVG